MRVVQERPVSFLPVDEFISGQETDVLGYSAAPHENNPKNYGVGPDHVTKTHIQPNLILDGFE